MRARGFAFAFAGAIAAAAPAGARTSGNDYARVSFCAAAALASLPSPADAATADPAVGPALDSYLRYWMNEAAEQGRKLGRDTASTMVDINRQNAAIHQAFETRSAPFYDLALCDDNASKLLWTIIPGPRTGPVSLDRLADDREVEIFHSLSGRLRPYFADLSAAEAFALDVRILALDHAIAQAGGGNGETQLSLATAFRQRRIGAGGLNGEHAVTAYQAAVDGLVDGPERAGALTGLCFAYLTRPGGDRADNIERAIAACQRALPLLDRPDTRRRWANTQQVLAGAFHERMRGSRAQNVENAIAADRAALSARSLETGPADWAATQYNLGAHLADRMIGDEQRNIEAAIAAYQAAGRVITRGASPQAWALLQDNLAPLVAMRGTGGRAANQEDAIGRLGDVLAVADMPGYLRSSASFHLGEIYRHRVQGDPKANLAEAVRSYRQAILGDPISERWPVTVGRALGAVLIGLGRYDEARDALTIATRAAERLIGLGIDEAQIRAVMSDAYDLYALSAFANAKQGDPRQALMILSSGKARLLFTALAADRLELAPAEQAELTRLRADLQRQESTLEALVRADPAGRNTSAGTVDTLEATRKRVFALYEKGSRRALLQPAPEAVAGEGALAAPVVTEFGSIVLVATTGGKVRSFDLPSLARGDVTAMIGIGAPAPWRSARKAADADASLADIQKTLGATFGAGLRRALDGAGVGPGASVVILPDGAGALLPISLALDAATGHLLLDDFNISFTPSLASIGASRRRIAQRAARNVALLAPPGDSDLEYASVENAVVGAAFGDTASGEARPSGKAALLPALAAHSYWHFATHGTFDWNDPKRSGVLVGTGGEWLTLSDLLEARDRVGQPRLVVLSACDTGLTDVRRNPDEFTGLATGFLFTGAAGVVASLWPVNDLSTALLMGKFYELHLKRGQSPAQALRGAQLWVRDASLAELLEVVRAQQAAGLATTAQADDMRKDLDSALQRAAIASGPEAKPFASPRYWGAFIIYGG